MSCLQLLRDALLNAALRLFSNERILLLRRRKYLARFPDNLVFKISPPQEKQVFTYLLSSMIEKGCFKLQMATKSRCLAESYG